MIKTDCTIKKEGEWDRERETEIEYGWKKKRERDRVDQKNEWKKTRRKKSRNENIRQILSGDISETFPFDLWNWHIIFGFNAFSHVWDCSHMWNAYAYEVFVGEKKKINMQWINRITHLIDRSICCVKSLHGLHCIRRLNTNEMNHMISKTKITTKFDNAINILMIRSASSCIIAWIFYDRQLCAHSTNTICKCVYVIIGIALCRFRFSIFRLHTTAAVLSSLNKLKTLNVFDEIS